MSRFTFWWLMFVTVTALNAPANPSIFSGALQLVSGCGAAVCMVVACWRRFGE